MPFRIAEVEGSIPFESTNFRKITADKRGEIRKQAKTLISSRFEDSGQTGYN